MPVAKKETIRKIKKRTLINSRTSAIVTYIIPAKETRKLKKYNQMLGNAKLHDQCQKSN